MPGPRKVRVFKDPAKSPNWYVEWRDLQGKRHCESCGPRRQAAKKRANQLQSELRAARLGSPEGPTPLARESTDPVRSGMPNEASTTVIQMVRLQTVLCLGQREVPVNLTIELTPELLQAFHELIGKAGDPRLRGESSRE